MENMTGTPSAISQRKYPLPEFTSIFEYRLNPLHTSDRESEAIDWCYKSSALPKETFDKTIGNASLFVDYFYPFCNNSEKFVNILQFILYLFVWDDHTENKYGQCRLDSEEGKRNWAQFFDIMHLLRNNEKSFDRKQFKSFSLAIHSIGAAICEDLNDSQRERFIDCWIEFGEGCQQENNLSKYKNKDLEQIKSVRDKAGAITVSQFLIEYGCDLSLTKAEWDEPRFQRLLLRSNRAISYVNDIYSFEKELKETNECLEEMSTNLVSYHLIKYNSGALDHLGVSNALEWLAAKVRKLESKINYLCSEISEDKNNSETVNKFADYLKYFIGANYYVSTKVERYNQFSA